MQSIHTATIHIDIDSAMQKIQELAGMVVEFSQRVLETGNAASQAAEEAARKSKEASEIAKEAQGKSTEEVKKTKIETEQLGNDAKKTGVELNNMGESGSKAGNDISSSLSRIELSSIISQVQGVYEAFANLAAPAIQFQQSIADLAAITGATGAELEELSTTARKVGVESGLGASESARAFAILAGQIDVPIDQLKVLQRETILLAQAGALPLEEASNAVAGTLNQFGLEASEASRVVNVLAAGSRAGGAEVVDLAESFKVAGAAANSAGVSVEETAAALEVLAQNNSKGAEAGTAMRNVLIAMQTRLGIDISKTGFVGGLQIIQNHLDTMGSETEKATFLAKTFGRENIVAAQFLLKNSDSVRTMTKEVTSSNAALEQAEIRNNTWAHKMEVMRSKMDEFRISLVDATGGMVPFLAGLGEQLVPLSQLTPLLTSLKGAFSSVSSVLTNSPIGKYAIIFGAIAGSVYLAYQESETFRNACQELGQVLQKTAGELMEQLKPAFESIMESIRELMPTLSELIGTLGNLLGNTIRSLMPIIQTLVGLFARLIPPIVGIIEQLIPLVEIIINALTPALDALGKLISSLEPVFKLLGWWLENFVIRPIQFAIELIADLFEWLGNLFEIDPPTDKINATTGAIKEQTKAIRENNEARGEGNSPVTKKITPSPINAPINESPSYQPTSFHSSKQDSGKIEKEKVYNLTTIEGLTNNISKLQEELNKSNEKDAIILQRKINEYQKLLDKLKEAIELQAKPLQKINAGDILDRSGNVKKQVNIWGQDEKEQKKEQEGQKKLVSSIADNAPESLYNATKKSFEKIKKEWDRYVTNVQHSFDKVSNLTGNLGAVLSNLGDITENSMLKAAGAWLEWGANVASTISDALPNLLALFNANLSVSASEAGKSQAGIPVIGPIMAAASIASIVASLTSLPKVNAFADGGIVYGPTLSLTGEYAGASSNPEVIAPLDKLRNLIQTENGTYGGGQVEFKIRGRELVGILSKEHNIRKLS